MDKALSTYESCFSLWKGHLLSRELIPIIAASVCEHLKAKRELPKRAAADTLTGYLGEELDRNLCMCLALQFTANVKVLRLGIPLRKFGGVAEPEWVPFSITNIRSVGLEGNTKAALDLMVLAGQYAGNRKTVTVKWPFLRFLAYAIDFTTRRFLYDKPHEMINCMFAGYVIESETPELEFEHFDSTSSMKLNNKQVRQYAESRRI